MQIVTQTIDDLTSAVGPLNLLYADFLIEELERCRRIEECAVSRLRMAYAQCHIKWMGKTNTRNMHIEVASDLNAYLFNVQPNFTENEEEMLWD